MINTKGLQIHLNDGHLPWFYEENHELLQDPHLWLDPLNAIQMVERIQEELKLVDPIHAPKYIQNSRDLVEKLKQLHQNLEIGLQTLHEAPFFVFHPAYNYLEKRYHLNRVGMVMIHPDRPTGARHLSKLRGMMRKNKVICLFSEPQFEPKLVQMLVEGTKTHTAVLDPLGSKLKAGPELYFTLLKNLGTSFQQCLDP